MKAKQLDRKLFSVLWFILALLPVIVYFVMNFRNSSPTSFDAFVTENFNSPFLKGYIDQIATSAGLGAIPAAGYISYLFSLEFIRLIYDVLVWAIRFARSFLEKGVFRNDN